VDNNQLIEDFFRNLKISLNNAFSYSKEHPYFIKSVENLKSKLEQVFDVLNPFKIGVTNSGIIIDGKNLTKIGFYDELARLLHQRKVKSIEIRSGVNLQELIQFLSLLSLSQKEIFKLGGINVILKNKQLPHFEIEELDYSMFLQGEGRECTDLWGYMLKEAAHSGDAAKLEQLADDFGPFIKWVKEKDILEAQEIPANISEFLTCLKEKNKEKFDKCSKDVFMWLLHNKKSINTEKLNKLKPVFDSLDHEDFSSLLWEGFLQDDGFDALSLQFFSRISEQKNSLKISESFFNKVNKSQSLRNNPNAVKRIQNLLSTSQDDQLSAVYRNTLKALVKDIVSGGQLFFDQKKLKENYRYIVLSMLSVDKEGDSLKQAAGILEKEFPAVFEDNDFNFLKELSSLLTTRKKEGIGIFTDLEKKLAVFIENILLNHLMPGQQEFLLEMIFKPSQSIDYYLDKIFNSEKTNQQVLSLFFKLFPGNLDAFYQRLDKKIPDIECLSNLINCLSMIEAPVTIDILKYIYTRGNDLIKFEVLKAMGKLKKVDLVFLMQQLSLDSMLIRKNLLSLFAQDAKARKEALNLLFKISSPWGKKNNFLIENMQIVFDLRINEAIDYINALSYRRFFWNSKLRNKAKQILKEWKEWNVK